MFYFRERVSFGVCVQNWKLPISRNVCQSVCQKIYRVMSHSLHIVAV